MTEESALDIALKKYHGNSNYHKPKADYIRKIFAMTDEELENECEQYIWLSAYASNNPRSDYHWQCDACYDAAKARDKKASIYVRAYERIENSL
jgi:hypothetical protein